MLSIALALSVNAYAAPSETEKNKFILGCPSNLSMLSKVEKESLPEHCISNEKKNWIVEQAEWLAGLVTVVGLGSCIFWYRKP
ncbi:hypothetical protein [Enterobacter quasiroggenkampii]|uniref:hypothetical protein n=1 Tax=Enterobacter quasiroggenkampii TaxID=2497436 RepID=UPI0021D0F9A1|nr:hypothetical protein [Enterobacter quasiroggenkampii]MCU6359057.1 hypothetical protein [Enterobacter quasiroggenkampii]